MSEVRGDLFNRYYLDKLDNPDQKKEAASVMGDYIHDQLREQGFARKVQPEETRTAEDKGIQVSTIHDGLAHIVELEPNSRAESLVWTGDPTPQYINARRFAVPFYKIGSQEYEKYEEELLASSIPIMKIIDANTVPDIHAVEDLRWLTLSDQCLARTNNIVKGVQITEGATTGQLQPEDIKHLAKLISISKLKMDKILMSQYNFDDLLAWDAIDLGDSLRSNVVKEGYSYDTLFGYTIIRTVKTDVLQPGNIYGYAAPQYLGKIFILDGLKFWINKERDRVFWWTWELIAMCIINCASIAKLELYEGTSNTLPAESTLNPTNVGTASGTITIS